MKECDCFLRLEHGCDLDNPRCADFHRATYAAWRIRREGDTWIVTRMGPNRMLVTDALFIPAEELVAEGERIGQVAHLAGRNDGSLGAVIAARQRVQLQQYRERLAARRRVM